MRSAGAGVGVRARSSQRRPLPVAAHPVTVASAGLSSVGGVCVVVAGASPATRAAVVLAMHTVSPGRQRGKDGCGVGREGSSTTGPRRRTPPGVLNHGSPPPGTSRPSLERPFDGRHPTQTRSTGSCLPRQGDGVFTQTDRGQIKKTERMRSFRHPPPQTHKATPPQT